MGYQIYQVGNRFCGYGVPAYCEHPDCNKEIDRGVSYACGGEPYSEHGCDRYFCESHLYYTGFDEEGTVCKHKEDCECELAPVCERCRDDNYTSFDYKPEHPDWIKHMFTDESWAEWRGKHPNEVKEMKLLTNKQK